MASLMVFSRPGNTKLRAIAQTSQPERGDVVDARGEDAFHWGDAVMGPAALGWWQIIVVPNAALSDVLPLCAASQTGSLGGTHWRHRLWSLDLDAMAVSQIPGGTWVVDLPALLQHARLKTEAAKYSALGVPGLVMG